MATGSQWRSPTAAADYSRHDLADFAQEFLRRNPDYQRDYAETIRRVAVDTPQAEQEMEGLARRWGLSFPLRAQCRSDCGAGLVVRRCRRECRH